MLLNQTPESTERFDAESYHCTRKTIKEVRNFFVKHLDLD